jgi:DDE superfamily endonuclease
MDGLSMPGIVLNPTEHRCENIVLLWLPAYSPELNPIERLWEDLKRRIEVLKGQVRSSLGALQEHVAGLVQRYSAEMIASLTGYAYLVEAIDALQF